MAIEKTKVEKVKKETFYEGLLKMDKEKATKYVVKGLIIAIIFGTLMLISASIAGNAANFSNLATDFNNEMYWSGFYGYQEHIQKSHEIALVEDIMIFQQPILFNLARLGANIGLVIVVIGFIGFATNDKLDVRTRWIALILAGVILVIIMFAAFFSSFDLTIG